MKLSFLAHPSLKTFASAAFGLAGLAGAVYAVQTPPAPPPLSPDQVTFFETKIRPVLVANCVPCHGKEMQMGGVRLDSRVGFAKGGDKGPLAAGNDPEASLLVHVVRYSGPVKMPPKGKLKPEQIADLEAWVKMGSPWPDGAPVKAKEKGPLWSLQPVRRLTPPKVKNAAWEKNPIDAFVMAGLEAKHLTPAAPADRRTLLRRVTYDLIGLPPTPEETAAFLADPSPTAYEKVVDRLLASPHYGERWGRHWLDVARYADTKGYAFTEDRNFPNAYTYREWVIRAFNADLPYDRFITEQLAADRLPAATSDDRGDLAAMGFLTIGRRFLNITPDIIDDRIDVTMRGFQAFTVGCARCHDHKFDPIPTQDYYSLYAVFNSSEEKDLPISPKPVREPWERYNARVAGDESASQTLIADQVKRLRGQETPPEIKAALQSFRIEDLPSGDTLNKLIPAFEPAAKDRLVALQHDRDEAMKAPPPNPEFAMAMVDRANPGDGVIFKRGNPSNPGDPAPRRFLKALTTGERAHWTEGSGRLELAKAIASKENPLTARVFVNRVWLHHFGAGLVRTPSDFGRQGEPPTDPALLDYLAATFMDRGWSVKKLQRLIVTSATYRQSCDASPAALNADPDNRTLNRMNRSRLDLEEMRDAVMAASGKLDLSQIGGKSVDLWSEPFTPRRAVYGFIERQNLPGIFRTFDFASPDSTSPRRFFTTVPQQALFFLNSPFIIQAAANVASRPEMAGAKSDGQRLRRLYLRLFDRLPDPDETAAGLGYLAKGTPGNRTAAWQYGYGGFGGQKDTFTPLAHFADNRYSAGPAFPDPKLGYLTLNAQGGHPGRDAAHAIIRRWTAPADLTLRIEGVLRHGQAEGDGVRALVVSSRSGQLGEWRAHHGEAQTLVASVTVRKGETLDFLVDPLGSDNSDSFAWSPKLVAADRKTVWDASASFGPPPPIAPSRLALYAQALMMTDEFMFVD